MIFTIHRLSKICLILLLLTNLIFFTCREEHTGRVSLIFNPDRIPPGVWLEEVKNELSTWAYIKKIQVLGLPENIIDIVFDKQKLQALGLNEEDISQQIKKQLPEQDNIKDLENIRIETKDGHLIPLAAIAQLKLRSEPYEIFYKGKQVCILQIECDKKMHRQLVYDLEAYKQRSRIDFVIDFNFH